MVDFLDFIEKSIFNSLPSLDFYCTHRQMLTRSDTSDEYHLNTKIKKGALRFFREIQTCAVAELHVNVEVVVVVESAFDIEEKKS